MFVGHTAVALAAKKSTPETSLGLLITAAYLVDLLWPICLLLGIEQVRIQPGNTAFTPLAFDSYPWTHSLAMGVVWALVLAGVSRVVFKAGGRAQLIIGLLVISHWILDFASHRPDLPLWPGSQKYGLGLWNSIPVTLSVEGALFVVGITEYLRATRAVDKIGTISFWVLVVFQLAIWVSQPWSPPPPTAAAIGYVGLAMWLFPLWAWWIDKHRALRDLPGG
jgi:hypothetical protein